MAARRRGGGAPAGPGRCRPARGLAWSGRDAHDPALAGAEAEALVGYVERPVASDGHCGREGQSGRDRPGRVAGPHAYDSAGAGGRLALAGAHLERVELAVVEGKSEHLFQPGCAYAQFAAGCDGVDVFVAGLIGRFEGTEVAEVEAAAPGQGGGDGVTLAG